MQWPDFVTPLHLQAADDALGGIGRVQVADNVERRNRQMICVPIRIIECGAAIASDAALFVITNSGAGPEGGCGAGSGTVGGGATGPDRVE
jgi:hypothetical protein